MLQFSWLRSVGMLAREEVNEPSQKAKLAAPPACWLDQAKRVHPAAVSPLQQGKPPL